MNSIELKKKLWTMMEKLENNEVKPDEARAMAALAKAMVDTTYLELHASRMTGRSIETSFLLEREDKLEKLCLTGKD